MVELVGIERDLALGFFGGGGGGGGVNNFLVKLKIFHVTLWDFFLHLHFGFWCWGGGGLQLCQCYIRANSQKSVQHEI